VSITVVLDMKIQAEQLDEFLTRLKANIPDTVGAAGCEYVNLHQALDDPNRVVLIEGWASDEVYGVYLAWRAERGDSQSFDKYYAEPPNVFKLVRVQGF
jgi:quinol monooxygenase YgiN